MNIIGDVLSLEEHTPTVGEEVFVFDQCWGEWVYAEYIGKNRVGGHSFLEGHNAYGEELYCERPTHFFRVQLPDKPTK